MRSGVHCRSVSPRGGIGSTWRERGSGGYTLLELMVTMSLVGIVLLAAGQIIAGAGRLLLDADRHVADPQLGSLSTTLRRDIHRSSAVVHPAPSWDEGPLDLASWDGGQIRYTLQGEALVREALVSGGGPASRRVIVNGVSSWWWRMVTPQLVEVKVTVLPRPGLGSAAADVRRDVVLRRYSVRGGPDGRSW